MWEFKSYRPVHPDLIDLIDSLKLSMLIIYISNTKIKSSSFHEFCKNSKEDNFDAEDNYMQNKCKR